VIDPRATVEDGARLADGVEIGPYAVVGPEVTLGSGVRIGAHAVIMGRTTLEDGVRVWPHAVIGGEPQDWSYDGTSGEVVIGPRTQLREFTSVHRGSKPGGVTRIGADCMLMNTAHVAHDCTVGDRVTMATGSMLGGHVTVGNATFISGSAAVHQFSWIGRLVIIGGLRRVPRDVPPFVMVNEGHCISGINVVGLRRAGVDAATRKELVRFVSRIRRADGPAKPIVEAWEPASAEGRELRETLLNPRRRGWTPFWPAGSRQED